MARYDNRLIKEAATGPLTAERIGKIVGRHGPDALTRLRMRRDMRVTVVGRLPHSGQGPARKLYKVEKITLVKGPYCCGYCEQQRQAATQA